MTTTTTTVNSTVLAADELIAVTGEKSLVKQWALADALLKASPAIQSHELAAVRQAAIDKAGHEEFWQVARLRQLARTAAAWPVASRIADVSLDAHHEAFRASGGNIAGATKVIVDAGKTSKVRGKPSIREIRAAVGANGTTAAPPRVDKADGAELFKRLIPRKKELADYLRKNLRPTRPTSPCSPRCSPSTTRRRKPSTRRRRSRPSRRPPLPPRRWSGSVGSRASNPTIAVAQPIAPSVFVSGGGESGCDGRNRRAIARTYPKGGSDECQIRSSFPGRASDLEGVEP